MGSTVTMVAIAIAILVFIIGSVVAYIIFRIFRKSFKTAVRLAMVAGLLFAIFAGAIAVVYFNTVQDKKPTKSAPAKKRQ